MEPTIRTRPLLVLDAELGAPQLVGATPLGTRKIVPVVGGRFTGERLRGTVLADGGHDWALVRADGSLVLDVRLVLETDDGARLLLTYRGLRSGPEQVLARLAAGEPVDPGEYYFRTQPLFETSDERYDWLNRIVCIATGERLPSGPRYHVHEVL